MRRYSIYILFTGCVIVFWVLFDIQLGYRLWTDEYRKDFAVQVDHLEDEAYLARSLLTATDNTTQLYELLTARKKTRNIDFWAVYHRDVLYKTHLEEWQIAALNITPDDLRKPGKIHRLNGVNHSYIIYDLGNHFTLVIGKTYALQAFLKHQMKARAEMIFKDVVFAVLSALFIFAFLFRDFRNSILEMTTRRKRDYSKIQVRSKEAELIVRGLAAYQDHSDKLTLEKDILSWQVLPSLRTELMSGRTPPYDFHCTLVRTDINNFSKIYNEYPVAPFTSTINDFFTDVTHVVGRYGGLVHEFIGDEVIYYFKDEDVGNSVAAALSAIRDINEIATHYNRKTLQERGYAFTVKSSFAHGSIQFRRFVNGFNLAGAVLIETVRILSHVVEKNGNVVVFNSRHNERIRDFVSVAPYAKVHLKGYQDEQDLSVYQQHKPLAELLAAFPTSFEAIRFYRSDSDLVHIIQWMATRAAKGQQSAALRMVSLLRDVRVTKSDLSIPITLAEWIEGLLSRNDRIEGKERDLHLQVLSAALKLMENLVPRENFDERLEGICRQAAANPNRRVIANALDVLTAMKSTAEPEFSRRLLQHEDNRVAANALVHEGSRGITPLVLKRLRKMLSSKEERFVASALYALGEISIHHKSRDPVYYQTQVDLLAMVAAIPVYVSHANEMIRKQALVAARKINDETVLARIAELVRESGSSDFAAEVHQHLDEKFVTGSLSRRSA